MSDKKLQQLEFILNVITRVNTSSLIARNWAVVLDAALFALSAKPNAQHLHEALIVEGYGPKLVRGVGKIMAPSKIRPY
jgi:hypothetical protein